MRPTENEKVVYTIVKREGDHDKWMTIGTAREDKDGTLRVELSSLPLDGKLYIRGRYPTEG